MKTKAKTEKTATKKAKKTAKAEATETKTLRSHIIERIIAGDTNQEIYDGLEDAGFSLEGKRKSYISWYRWDAVRKGLVKKKFAAEHAGERVSSKADADDEETEEKPKAKKAKPAAKKAKKAAKQAEETEDEEVELEEETDETDEDEADADE